MTAYKVLMKNKLNQKYPHEQKLGNKYCFLNTLKYVYTKTVKLIYLAS